MQISRSSVQRILREERPTRRALKPALMPPEGAEPYHLLAPQTANRVWQIDLMEVRIVWFRFTIAALMGGFSRKLLRLKVFKGTPATAHMVRLVRSAVRSFGKPRFLICDHGGQFGDRFTATIETDGMTVVKGKVRQPSFNGKVERLFRTLRIWLRVAVLPLRFPSLQRRLFHYQAWYNEHRPHASLGGRTTDEAWNSIELPESNPIRATDSDQILLQIHAQAHRGDPTLPVVTLKFNRKEAA